MKLDFKEATHTYYLDGQVIPSVTQILKEMGLIEFGQHQSELESQISMSRGTAVHKACELLDMEDLDWETVDPRIHPYIEAWQRFKKESGFEVQFIEKQCYSPFYRFAGTIDRTGSLNGKPFIIDLKTGSPQRFWPLQIAGYELCLYNEVDRTPWGRACLQLKADGSYNLHSYSGYDDRGLFLSCVGLYNWKKQKSMEDK